MPAIAARPVAPSAVESVYADLGELIAGTARKFADRYSQDREECLADANLFFLQAYHTFDPARGRLVPRVRMVIWNRLLDKLRLKASRYELRLQGRMACRASMSDRDFHRTLRDDADACGQASVEDLYAVPAPPEPTFDRDGFFASLSADARTVAELVLGGPAELRAALAESPHPSEPGTVRAAVRRFLGAAGWTGARIGEAFAEIGGAL